MSAPGQWILSDHPVEINAGRRTIHLKVRNTGDRPIQVGSHFHFFEVNRALDFDRPSAMGMHLNIASGTDVRFEPGDEKEIELVDYGGMRRVIGFNALVNGSVQARRSILEGLLRARELSFGGMEHLGQQEQAVLDQLTKERQGIRHQGEAPLAEPLQGQARGREAQQREAFKRDEQQRKDLQRKEQQQTAQQHAEQQSKAQQSKAQQSKAQQNEARQPS